MLEMRITIAAPDLAAAINNLAAALDGKNPHTVCNQYGTDNKPIDYVGTITMGMSGKARPATPAAPVNPTPAPVNPTTPVVIPAEPASITTTAAPIVAPTPVQTNAAPTVPAVPTSAPQYTLDMIATAGSALIDAGKMNQLMQLLGKFGVASLTELAPESYGAVAGELRALGATI